MAPIDRTECNARTNAAGVPQHGTKAAYANFGCRCSDACAASRNYKKLKAAGIRPPAMVNGIGSARRIQALACMGWGLKELAPRLGLSFTRLGHISKQKYPEVWKSTHRTIRDLYLALQDVPGPSDRVRQTAATAGWAPPAAWDNIDDASELPQHQAEDTGLASEVEEYSELAELLAGHSKLNASWLPTESLLDKERRLRLNGEAIKILEGYGLEASEIANRLKLSDRTVHRYRNLGTVGPPRDNATSTTKAGTTPSASTSERHHEAA